MAGLTCCWVRICVVSVAIIMQLALLVEFVGAMLQFLADRLRRRSTTLEPHSVCSVMPRGVDCGLPR